MGRQLFGATLGVGDDRGKLRVFPLGARLCQTLAQLGQAAVSVRALRVELGAKGRNTPEAPRSRCSSCTSALIRVAIEANSSMLLASRAASILSAIPTKEKNESASSGSASMTSSFVLTRRSATYLLIMGNPP
jgi:hypothetical protein